MIGANFPSFKQTFFQQATKQFHRYGTVTRTVEFDKDEKDQKKKKQQRHVAPRKQSVFKYNKSIKNLNSPDFNFTLPIIEEESSKNTDKIQKSVISSALYSIHAKNVLTSATLASINTNKPPPSTPKKILESSKFKKSIIHASSRNFQSDATNQKDQIKTHTKINSKLYTIGCGFSKDDNPQINISSEHCIDEKIGSRNFGEDAAFVTQTDTADIMGVSDGVGGWRNQGVDPSVFSGTLMKNCLDIANSDKFNVEQPIELMDQAYKKLMTVPDLIGSATACTATFDRHTKILYTANLGDSGWLVVRNGKIIAKSNPQCHYFNAPYQLAKVPKPRPGGITNYPKQAQYQAVQTEIGDIIILATDGLFDNVYDQHVTEMLKKLSLDHPSSLFGKINSSSSLPDSENSDSDESSQTSNESNRSEVLGMILENSSKEMVKYTRMRAHQKDYFSPFCQEYLEASRGKIITGGKVDDITILMSIVGPKKLD